MGDRRLTSVGVVVSALACLGPAPGLAFTRVTALYERARFGGTPPTRDELEEARVSVATLGRGRR